MTDFVFSGDNSCRGYSTVANPFLCGSNGNCVWWAAYKRPDLKAFMNHDAGQWYSDAQNRGFRVGQSPRKFAIAVLNVGSYGHVAHVENVNNDGSFAVTEMDYTGSWGVGMLQATYYPSGNGYRRGDKPTVYPLIGFIYPKYCEFLSTNVGVYCWNTDNGYFQEDMDGVDHVIYKRLTSTTHSTTVLTSQQATQYSLDIASGVYSNVRSIDLGEYFQSGNASYAAYGGMGVGPGYETTPTDTANPGLPNFIGKKIELNNYNPKRTDSIQIYGYSKNTGVNDIDSDDEIESRYFLSVGHKKDSSSDWIKIGSDITHGSSLDPGESHREDKAFRLWEYNIIQPGGTYNVVYCIDRTRNHDNDGGEYPEEHESDNCTTEAVFHVQAEAPPPPSTDKFVWSSAGPVANRVCTQIIESADPYTWNDNYFCADSNYGIAWSSAGPIANMRCTQIIESADPHSWNDNYLCIPNTSNIYFSWSSAGPIDSQTCVQWLEASDPYTWKDNFLCYRIQDVTPPPPPPTYNLSVNNISLNISGRDKLWPDGFFDLGITVVNTGNNLTGNVSVGYYLNETLLTTHTIDASDLANGAYRSDALPDIPSPLTPGDHTAKICVDPNNVIQETDETDNCHSIKVKVEEHVSPAAMLLLFQ